MSTGILPDGSTARQTKWAPHNAVSVAVALEAAVQGLPIFPAYTVFDGACSCRDGAACKTAGKHPAIKGWQDRATTDPDAIRKMFSRPTPLNAAIATGARADVVVVDVDPRNGGFESWSSLLGKLTPSDRMKIDLTPKVKTPSGGFHFYFRHPGGSIRNSIGILPGIDIKGDGGQVPAPIPSARAASHTCQRFRSAATGWLMHLRCCATNFSGKSPSRRKLPKLKIRPLYI